MSRKTENMLVNVNDTACLPLGVHNSMRHEISNRTELSEIATYITKEDPRFETNPTVGFGNSYNHTSNTLSSQNEEHLLNKKNSNGNLRPISSISTEKFGTDLQEVSTCLFLITLIYLYYFQFHKVTNYQHVSIFIF